MEFVFILLFAFIVFTLIRSFTVTYEKELTAELAKQGWALISYHDPSWDELQESPFYSFISLRISGLKSVHYIAIVEKEETRREVWVKINVVFSWVASIEFQVKQKGYRKDKTLSQEQIERLL